jgi:heme-degrading monooxygenase HmoA
MAAPAHRIVLRMEIVAGEEERFERAWREGARTIAREPANLGQWLSRSADEPGVYYIVSDWVDRSSFVEYERSERHRLHRARLHPYRRAGSMTTMDMVAEVPGAASGDPGATEAVQVLLFAAGAPDDDAVTGIYHHISRQLAGTPGLLGNRLLARADGSGRFVVVSEWESLAAFRAWEDGPDHRGVTAPLRPYHDRSMGAAFGVYQVTASY